MRDRLQLKDALNVDNNGSMYPNESHRVELIDQFVKRGAVQQFLSGNVQIYVDTRGFDPVNVYYADEACRSSGFHHQPVNAAIGCRRGRNQLWSLADRGPIDALGRGAPP